MATKVWVNIGSGNGLVPDGAKPLPYYYEQLYDQLTGSNATLRNMV